MTEAKFTKGPWYITEEDWEKTSKRDMVVIYDNDGEEVLGIIGSILVDEPNLQLMSAAPDMYEALEGVCSECPDKAVYECKVCPVGQALRKARAKEEAE